MIVKKLIKNLLFIGLILSFAVVKPAYSEAESGSIVTNINNKFNYIKNMSKKADEALKEADKVLIKTYKDSNIEKNMDDFSKFMGPLSTAAGQKPEKYLFHITRTTTKTVASNIAKHTLIVIDKVGTISKVAGSLSTDRKDWIGVNQAIYDSIMSGAFAYAGGTAVTFAIGSNPIGWAVGTVGGVVLYLNTLEPEANKAFEQIALLHIKEEADENIETNRKRKNEIKNIKKNATRHYQKSCKEWLKEYKETGKRQDRIVFNLCKKYGIDIYDLCPTNPNKKDPGVCGCDKLDIDSDGDRVFDCHDGCKNNPKLSKKGKYGKDGCQTEDDWRSEQIEAADLNCTRYQFIQWNKVRNAPECVCQGGMKWSESENECIDERLADQEPVKTCKDIKHAENLPLFEGRYYCNCISPFEWSDNTETECVCPKPLVINKAKNDCISCNERYPGTIPANTEKGCACPKETKWVKDLNQCVNQKMLVEYCDKKIPGSVPGKKRCVCPEGREKSKSLNICVEVSDTNKTAEKVLNQIVYRIEGGGYTPHYGGKSYEKVGYRDVLVTLKEPATEAYILSIIKKVHSRYNTDPCDITSIPTTPGYKMRPSIWKNGPKVTIIRGPTTGLSSEVNKNGWKIVSSEGPSFSKLKKAAGCKK